MFFSIITVILFLTGVLGVLLFPKSDGKLNGIKLIIMGTMAVFCFLAFCAAVYNKLGIPVHLPSACVSLTIMNAFLWGGIIKKKKVQRLFWRWSDAVCILLLGMFVMWLALHVFTPELKLQYSNVDAAAHYRYANEIVFTGKIFSLTYFSAYVDAFIIEILAPAFSTVLLYYKAFIVADIFMHLMEIWMFYCLVLTISEKKVVRIMAPVLAVGYFWGYPAYSFMEGHFVYWSNGVVILIFILYALLLIEKEEKFRKCGILLLLLGLYANTCCNKLFVPVNTAAVFGVLVVWLLQKYWKRINRKRFVIWKICGILAVAAAVGVYIFIWGDSLTTLFEDIIRPGGIYSSLYADQIYFLPPLFYVLWYTVTKRSGRKTIPVVSVCMLFVALAMYAVMCMHYMSGYYYHKIDYNLWLCGWLLAAEALGILAERRQLAWYFSYAGMIILLCIICLTDYDTQIEAVHADYNGEYATTQLLPVYRYNRSNLLQDYEEFLISAQVMDVFNYALQQMSDVNVCIVTDDWNLQMWHDGLDLSHAQGFYFEEYELTELLGELDAGGVQAIIVRREDEKYQAYQGYFEQCTEVYGNEEAAILTPSGERWLEIPEEVMQYEQSRLELYQYVGMHYGGKEIPLMAAQDAYYDYMLYYLQTGNLSTNVYPWKQVEEETLLILSDEDAAWETAQKTMEALSENDISYIVVLNGDSYYEKVKSYLDVWKCVYENEAGKVLMLDGEDE